MSEMNERDLEQVVGGAADEEFDVMEWYKENCKHCANWKVSCTAKLVDARLRNAKSAAAQGKDTKCPFKK